MTDRKVQMNSEGNETSPSAIRFHSNSPGIEPATTWSVA